MDISAILMMLIAKFPVAGVAIALLGILVIAGQAVVAVTPSKADDAAWEKIKAVPVLGALLAAVSAFAPIQKK